VAGRIRRGDVRLTSSQHLTRNGLSWFSRAIAPFRIYPPLLWRRSRPRFAAAKSGLCCRRIRLDSPLERVHQTGYRDLRRMVDEQMDVMICPDFDCRHLAARAQRSRSGSLTPRLADCWPEH
jgi:hypothetical protein